MVGLVGLGKKTGPQSGNLFLLTNVIIVLDCVT